VALSHQTNCLPEITGRVCPQDRLCEGACTLRDEHGAVTIGNIERYISDQALARAGVRISPGCRQRKKVAIIGAGPAGWPAPTGWCATACSRWSLTVIRKLAGLLTFGIPAFKLDKSLLARRREIFTRWVSALN
jgi:NADPH-dependent glutamate synthase beta subunit-like oxidoreductase